MAITTTEVEELATAPKRTTTEEGTVEEREMKETIVGDQYSANKSAADAVPWGIRMARIKPGGTV